MNKSQLWKLMLIIGMVVLAFYLVWPPHLKLKPGIDLGGGTSLIYDFNTYGMDKKATKGLAKRNIPILRERIDPTNVANIVIRPLGDTRIEIQLPMASADTIKKRKAYETALKTLEKENLNLATITRALPADKEKRQEVFAQFVAGTDSEKKKEILDNLATAYDQYITLQNQEKALKTQMADLKGQIDALELSGEFVERSVPRWAKLDKDALDREATAFIRDKQDARSLIDKYIVAWQGRIPVINELADAETGKTILYKKALDRLAELNLSIAQLTDILELPEKSPKRQEYLKKLEDEFPDRTTKIEEVATAFDIYRKVGGRLDDPEDLKRMLKGSGVLEFRILPTAGDGKITETEIQGYLEALKTKGPKQASDRRYIWCELEDNNPAKWRAEIEGSVVGIFGDKSYVLASNQKEDCMLHGGEKEWELKRAYKTRDTLGSRAIGFDLDEIATKLFFALTKNNIGKPLCILLDEKTITAPNIKVAIYGDGIITGTFTELEVEETINKLNAGSFQASLSEVPISEKTIGPAVGAENRNQGIYAGLIGLAAVLVFMLFYYLLAGSIADMALLMNMLFVLAMMVIFRATFTLPGIAGLILTIGMSVDANVLIFERIREEQIRGSSLRTAIANGYQRAFRTIFDANITTIFVALILYMVASEEIKGFAIVLMFGIASSMFTALFATRVIFNFLLDKKIIRNHIVMLRLIRKPDINWMGLRTGFFILSTLLIVGGLAVFFIRSDSENSKYDIEFTGGTSAQINLKEGNEYVTSDIKKIIYDKAVEIDNPGLMAAKVYSVGKTGREFEINTTETNKTTATATFPQNTTETAQTVTVAIETAMEGISGELYNLTVTGDAPVFTITTSQVNKALLDEVLRAAFTDKAEISEPIINEVVSRAIREAFGDLLDARKNLKPTITFQTEPIDESVPELADYIGGARAACQLEEETTFADLQDRLDNIRFKPDMRDVQWYGHTIFTTDLTQPEPEAKTKSFVYVSVHPEAAYRDLSPQEWARFIDNEKTKITIAASLQTSLARVTQIDPSIGAQAKTRAIIAIILSLIAIVAYIWMRFGTALYGFAAIAALLHDVCITLGAVVACTYIAPTALGKFLLIGDFKINLEMIAAFLTIIGYSLNDTIVVFDRIRENKGKQDTLNPNIISNSINQTLSRTILTSFTTFLVVLVMYIWGGAGLRGFTFAMLVGILVGTYSSVAIAAPILLLGGKSKTAQKK